MKAAEWRRLVVHGLALDARSKVVRYERETDVASFVAQGSGHDTEQLVP